MGGVARAEVAAVAVRVPSADVWSGQRAAIHVELRARGTFAGTADFVLPALPGVLMLKVGNPVIESREIEGETWFVQSHEFALFAQKPGVLAVPDFPVHFSRREGYTGPVTDVSARAPGFKIGIARPPGSEGLGFVVTTGSLEVIETWDPLPGAAPVGTIFKRTIVQRAPDLPGMALAPAPGTAPEGIRLYPGRVETRDNFERGAFRGERRETLTYVLQTAGTHTLPAIAYLWWNPQTQQLQSHTLPAVNFEAAAAASRAQAPGLGKMGTQLLAAVLVAGAIFAGRARLGTWWHRVWRTLNPPDRKAARQVLRGCRAHDAAATQAAWVQWRNTRPPSFQPIGELHLVLPDLHRQRFGPAPVPAWRGNDFARAFRRQLAANQGDAHRSVLSSLPELNPLPPLL
jgi:hypothetical protein